jgi:hypothetical protein
MGDPKSEIGLLQTQLMSMMSAINGLKARGMDAGGEDGPPETLIMGGTSYSNWAFGFSIRGAVVTVNSGKVRHGTRTPVTAAGKDITIAADQTWVFVTYYYGTSTASITSSTSEPVNTEEVHNHALFLVTLTGGIAQVESGNIRSLGDIFIPGAFA